MNQASNILLVDDDALIRIMVEDVVIQMGHHFHYAENGAMARKALKSHHFDLVILDRRLPDTDGLLLGQAITAQTPFIVLSSLKTPNDQVLGLGMGAQDYICKPVEPSVLRAKIEMHLAPARAEANNDTLVVGDTLRLDAISHRLWVSGRLETLSPAETRLLSCLIRSIGRPLNRNEICQATSRRDWVYGDRTVDVLVARLRQRLQGSTVQIGTVHGVGYILLDEPVSENRPMS